jgi:hypothetical protein
MQLIHSSPAWEPDLSSPAQLAQAEQNWPGLGGSEADLAAWARLYGTACLDFASDNQPVDQHAIDDAFEEGVRSCDETTADYEGRLKDALSVAADASRFEDCMNAVACALEDLAADDPLSDLLVLAKRLRDGV